MRRRDFVGWSAAAAASWLARAAVAQETNPNHAYPNRPIHVIVPSSAGGVHDVVARIWADRVKSALGAMVIENRSGGGASIAINAVAQSQPDGYTLLLGSTSNLVLREGLGNRVYDSAKDLAAASIFATTSTSITVNPAVPARTVNELVDFIKANPGKLSYGSGGTGAITHITVEMFKQMAGGLDIVHVPYKGMAPAMNDLLSGEIAVGFVNITAQVIALHRGGKIRILAVNAPARLAAAPDIPTAIADVLRTVRHGRHAEGGARQDQPGDPYDLERQGLSAAARRVRLRADARLRTRAGGCLSQAGNCALGADRSKDWNRDAMSVCLF
jgi:tripartite-type tricarboxylate transporter receptor subunit TctC